MLINVVGPAIAPGAGLDVFSTRFVVGAPLSVLMLYRPMMAGKVLAVEDRRVLLEIEGARWWVVPAPGRRAAHTADSPVRTEAWEISSSGE